MPHVFTNILKLQVTQALSWVVRMYSELEVNVVSVERVNEYSELVTECALVSSTPPSADWPQKGLCLFSGFQL